MPVTHSRFSAAFRGHFCFLGNSIGHRAPAHKPPRSFVTPPKQKAIPLPLARGLEQIAVIPRSAASLPGHPPVAVLRGQAAHIFFELPGEIAGVHIPHCVADIIQLVGEIH